MFNILVSNRLPNHLNKKKNEIKKRNYGNCEKFRRERIMF